MKCDCRVVPVHDLPRSGAVVDWIIQYCSDHAAAFRYRGALEKIANFYVSEIDGLMGGGAVDIAREALATKEKTKEGAPDGKA